MSDDETKSDDEAKPKPVDDAKSDDKAKQRPVSTIRARAETKPAAIDDTRPEPVDETSKPIDETESALDDETNQEAADEADVPADDALLQNAFPDARPTERALWEALNGSTPGESRAVAVVASFEDDTVRGPFLRWFLLEAMPAKKLPIIRVELQGATIRGRLDLAGTKLDYLLRFRECDFQDAVDLDDARIFGVDLLGGTATKICCDRLVATGSLRLCGADEFGNTAGPRIARISLHGAKISGNLDLRRATLTNPDATDDDDPPLHADGLTVSGSILLRDGFTASGEISLNGCKIQRNLDCTSATLTNPDGHSLSAAGAEITGTAYFCYEPSGDPGRPGRRFVSIGTLRLDGAKIQGDLDCTGAHFTARAFHGAPADADDEDVYALTADDLTVGANVMFVSDFDPPAPGSFIAKGVVSIINARVGGDFDCKGAVFELAGEEALWADGITVSAETCFNGVKTDGILRFLQASLKQGLSVKNATFNPTHICRDWFGADTLIRSELDGTACGIYARSATIGGTFTWEEVTKTAGRKRNPFWLYLQGAKADEFEDDEESWVALDRFGITDFIPGRIPNLTNHWGRLAQIDREYAILNEDFDSNRALGLRILWRALQPWRDRAADVAYAAARFRPQPYIQLARTLRAAGYDTAAKDVLVHLERNRTRYSDFGAGLQLWRWLLDATIHYGYSPFKPVIILLVWAAVCSAFFQTAFDNGRIISIKELQATASGQGGSSAKGQSIGFNPLIYALDTLVPIVDLNQKKNWIVNPLSRDQESPQRASWAIAPWRVVDFLPQGTGWLIVFNTFFGWLMTTLFVAGIGGLLRTRDA